MKSALRFTYIGGSTALIEFGGLRFLTDPTFDPAGSKFATAAYVLERTTDPALSADSVLPVDAVLLSHDHHFDNLDDAGRFMLPRASKVLTTKAGAERLGKNALGLEAWDSLTISTPNGGAVTVTATPARHGPEGGDRGPVIGFVLKAEGSPSTAAYVSGDTVWFEGVEEVARRFSIGCAVMFMGAARVKAAGPHHLTFTADEGVKAARAMPEAKIVPLHYEGWQHFSEGRAEIEGAFRTANMEDRLVWCEAGRAVVVSR